MPQHTLFAPPGGTSESFAAARAEALEHAGAAPTTATPRRRRDDVVRNSTRTATPPQADPWGARPERPGDLTAAAHPVSDGRGGTVWR